jgi:hypothetical protein
MKHFNAEISAGSLLPLESRRIARLLLSHPDSAAWQHAIEIDNILQKKTVATARRQAIPEYAGKRNFYLSAVDSLLKRDDDQPTIGLLVCRDKNNIEVEFALRDMAKPMGVSEYTLVEALPDNLKGAMPTVEEIENDLQQLQTQGGSDD